MHNEVYLTFAVITLARWQIHYQATKLIYSMQPYNKISAARKSYKHCWL